MTCKLCSYQFCWICGAPASYEHFMPISIFGCGVNLEQKSYLNRFTLFGFKIMKYLCILLTIVVISVILVPCLIGNLLYKEDKKWLKSRLRRRLSESVLWDSPSGVFITQTMRNFFIVQGVIIGFAFDLIATPLLLVLGLVSVVLGAPIMFYIEWSDRQKIHTKATNRLRNILTRNEKLYHGVYNE